MDLTKRQQEIFDFIKRYSASHGYPPTVRDIGKAVGLASSSTVHAHLANLEKLGPAAARSRPSRARSSCSTAPRGPAEVRTSCGRRAGLPLVGARRRRPADPRRGEHRGVRPGARRGRRRRGRVRPARARRLDEERGHPRGRLRRRAPAGHRRRRRDRRRAGGRGGDGQALLPRGRPRPPAARERRRWSRSAAARSASSAGSSACCRRCDERDSPPLRTAIYVRRPTASREALATRTSASEPASSEAVDARAASSSASGRALPLGPRGRLPGLRRGAGTPPALARPGCGGRCAQLPHDAVRARLTAPLADAALRCSVRLAGALAWRAGALRRGSRGGRGGIAFEESPDITGQGGR